MKTDRKRAEEAVTAALRALRASSTENEMFEALAAGAWAARWLQAEQPDRAGWKCPPNGVPTCEALARWLMRDQSATSGQAVHEAERSITELIPDHSLMVIARRNEGEPEPDDEEEGIYVIRKSPENGPLVARFFYPLAHRAWTEAAEAAAGAGRKAPAHPIAVLVTAWQQQLPRPVRPETRPERILPSRLAMVQPAHRLADRGLFAVAAHRQPGADGQPVLPGFEIPEVEGPALPLALYDLGVGPNLHGGTRGAPLGLRFWIESVLSVPLDERLGDRPVAMEITLRELLARLYTSERRPRPNEYWPRLMAAVEALDSPDARIPWFDPITKRGGLRRVVTASDIPRGPNALDDLVTLTVHLPPGARDGPIMPRTLAVWGVRGAAPYRALINLSFRWHQPGRTRIPVHKHGRRIWIQSNDPRRYEPLSDEELIRLCFPCSATKNRREMLRRSLQALERLQTAGELRIVDRRRILPPAARCQPRNP